MNYNNFKRHDYNIYLWAFRNSDGSIDKITLTVTRENNEPFGEIVTDYYETKYACRICGFDFDSLDIDEDSRFFIKKDSIEWNKYLAEPGSSAYNYLAKKGLSDNQILNICKDLFGQGSTIIYYS